MELFNYFLGLLCTVFSFSSCYNLKPVSEHKKTLLFMDKNLQKLYLESNDSIRMFAKIRRKKSIQPEFLLYAPEIKDFRNMFSYLSEEQVLDIYRKKGKKSLAEFLPADRPPKIVGWQKPPLPARPLEGLRIALDPGHIAGSFEEAKMEDRFVRIRLKRKTIKFYESELAYYTVLMLRDYLKRDGARVFVTRKGKGKTAFGMSFADWRKKKLKQTLKEELALDNITAKEKKFFAKNASDRELFHRFFKKLELNERARIINQFHPHFTIVIHYNIEPDHIYSYTRGSSIGIAKNNYSMSFVPGGFEKGSMDLDENRMNLLRLLVTNHLEKSLEFCSFIQESFEKNLKVPHIPGNKQPGYMWDTSLETGILGVYSRNLRLTRKVFGPICYGESLYQNNEKEFKALSRKDDSYRGVKIPKRLRENARAYYKGIRNYLRSIHYVP